MMSGHCVGMYQICGEIESQQKNKKTKKQEIDRDIYKDI
jgi:sulfite exporter TauE/SafE